MIAFTIVLLLLCTTPASAQHTIILRDLTLIENASIESLDGNGIKIENGLRYSWADVLKGSVGEFQKEFDERLKSIGEPLFRVRSRLALGNYAELQPMTGELLTNLKGETGPALYIAYAAEFQDRLYRGKRESAVVPVLRLLDLRSRDPTLTELDSRLGLRFLESGICASLLPVWFDPQAARNSFLEWTEWKQSIERDGKAPADQPQSSARQIYIDSLRVCCRHDRDAIDDIDRDLGGWSPILSAQSALLNRNHALVIESLKDETGKRSAEQRAIALYYRGLANQAITRSSTETFGDDHYESGEHRWVLQLLQIPATWQDQFPELAAAAIYEIISDPGQDQATIDSLSLELTGRFSNTWHGRQYHQDKN